MRANFLGLLAVSVLLSHPLQAQAGFVASPMKVQLDVVPGLTGESTISLVNVSSESLTVRAYLADSRFYPDGSEEALEAGTMERSCAPWVSLNNQILELDGNETVQIRMEIEVPEDAVGSYWAMLYIEQVNLPEAASRESHEGRHYEIFMLQRLGVRLFVDVLGTTVRDARITLVDASADSLEHGTVGVTITNVGNTILRCDGWVEIRQSNGMTADKLPLGIEGRFTVFPKTSRHLTVRSESSLSPDTYTALTIVDFGGPHLVAGEDVFEIDNPLPSGITIASPRSP